MATRTLPFDSAEHLTNPEDQAELLNDAFESGDIAYIANALGTIARARGMSKVARGAGVTREALQEALSNKGDPKLTAFINVLTTLNLKLSAHPMKVAVRRRKIGLSSKVDGGTRKATGRASGAAWSSKSPGRAKTIESSDS